MESIWYEGGKHKPRERLEGNMQAQVVVIGGGIAGILTAYLLSRSNVDCVLLEAERLLSGITLGTTAKVTCQHDACYAPMIRALGAERASLYAQANQKALQNYRQIIAQEKIDCSWVDLPTYLYTDRQPQVLEAEQRAMRQLGFSGELTEKTTLPFPVKMALRMDGQAVFHPLRFLWPLADKLHAYEHTQALGIDGHTVRTEHGKVSAEHIVVATHFPFINIPGYYFARMHQERSYVLALETARPLDGAYLGIDSGAYSLRPHEGMTLLGGMGHRTGRQPPSDAYRALRAAARRMYPGHEEICSYSAQDCMPHDRIPLMGKYSAAWPHVHVLTGFSKWGMTTSMAGAMLLTAQILGQEPPEAKVFTPQRQLMRGVVPMLRDGFAFAGSALRQIFVRPSKQADDLALGEGDIILFQKRKVGAYRQGENALHCVNVRCPHMGCELAWNPQEKSWDCPCHGSRFDSRGKLLGGPASKGLPHEKKSR